MAPVSGSNVRLTAATLADLSQDHYSMYRAGLCIGRHKSCGALGKYLAVAEGFVSHLHRPTRRFAAAVCSATSPDEQAVSMAKAGPRKPNV